MHGNAVTVARLLVIVAFAARSEAAEPGLRKPASANAPLVVQPAAPVAAAAKAPEPSPAVVHRALVAAGKTYEALSKAQAQATGGKIQGSGAGTRLDQAKQLVAKLHAANQKAAPAKQDSNKHVAPALPPMPQHDSHLELDAELREAEEQEQKKVKELKVQAGLAKEKEIQATKAQKRGAELRERAKKLRKEADVAADIAKEKSKAAVKAEKGMKATESRVKNLLVEEGEMQRVLNQTEKEELALEHNISSLKLQEAKLPPSPKVAAPAPKVGAAVASKAAPPLNQEAMQKLVEENNKLKHEKAMLEQQLSDRKVAKEKAKLKQKLKNRLALADRHMKMQKKVLRRGH